MPKRKKKIEQRKRIGKTLKSGFSLLPNANFSSWRDEALPNVLWAVCLRGNLEQGQVLELFRRLVVRFREKFDGQKNVSLCHDDLAQISTDDFDYMFEEVLLNEKAVNALRPLALLDSLPDCHHWRRTFPDVNDQSVHWNVMANAVMSALDHQSQESTDVRWLKVISFALIGRLIMPEDMVDKLRLYPDEGDQRSVRPMIRATEMSLRNFETGSERDVSISPMDVEQFWAELLQKTACLSAAPKFERPPDPSEVQSEIRKTLNCISEHFMQNIQSSGVDARADGAFGLALYGTSLCHEVSISPSQLKAGGRILLRSIVDAFITLSFLAKKDDPTIWAQYRNYGAGQTALAFIKMSDADEWPSYVSAQRLELLANEDIWHEMRDINIGSWANTDLRKMAEFAGVKDVYDRYYDWTSGFSHGHWGCVRDTTLTTCLNPLHRLHRVPAGPAQMPSVLEDCCKISNRMIDVLNSVYPGIKRRIDWKSLAPSQKPASEE